MSNVQITEGTCYGSQFIADGYATDSRGEPIVPGAQYNYIAHRYIEPVLIWMAGTEKPDAVTPLKRKV